MPSRAFKVGYNGTTTQLRRRLSDCLSEFKYIAIILAFIVKSRVECSLILACLLFLCLQLGIA